jgi:predicted transcriptional regulator of viral defense system
MRHADISVTKLLEYAKRLDVGSVYRRLGYLLERFGIATGTELQTLRNSLTATYDPLDPLLPREGSHLAKGRLQLNIPPDEFREVRSTGLRRPVPRALLENELPTAWRLVCEESPL